MKVMNNLRRTSLLSALILAFGGVHAASAAEIELFGFLDQGISYIHEELNEGMSTPVGQSKANMVDANGYVAENATRSTVEQGTGNPNNWGIRGTEKINDDLTIAFMLHSAFLPDDGTIYGKNSPLFEREASLALRSKTMGELRFGRMPAITSGSGATGIFNSKVNPFGGGWGNLSGGWKFTGTLAQARWNNMVNYISPTVNGVKFHLQHSFGDNADGTEGTSKTDRFTAAGITWTGPKFYVALGADWLKKGSKTTNMSRDQYKVLLGGHYKFDDFKLYGTTEYMKNVRYIGAFSTKELAPLACGQTSGSKGVEGWAFNTGADVPLPVGLLKTSIGVGFGENQNLSEQNKYVRFTVGAGYLYPLSKRTQLYGLTGYFQQDADWQRRDISAHELILGVIHTF